MGDLKSHQNPGAQQQQLHQVSNMFRTFHFEYKMGMLMLLCISYIGIIWLIFGPSTCRRRQEKDLPITHPALPHFSTLLPYL